MRDRKGRAHAGALTVVISAVLLGILATRTAAAEDIDCAAELDAASDEVVFACSLVGVGTVRILDPNASPSSLPCLPVEELICWSRVPAAGPQGSTGPSGPAGATGATGPVGPQGSPGAPGVQGAQGIQGPPGAPGPTGPTGAEGETGATGPAGTAGQDAAGGALQIQQTLFADTWNSIALPSLVVSSGPAAALVSYSIPFQELSTQTCTIMSWLFVNGNPVGHQNITPLVGGGTVSISESRVLPSVSAGTHTVSAGLYPAGCSGSLNVTFTNWIGGTWGSNYGYLVIKK